MDAYQDELFRRELVLLAELIKLLGRDANRIFKDKNEFGHIRDKMAQRFGLEERVNTLDEIFHNLSSDELSYEFVKCDGISPEMLSTYHEYCETYYGEEHNFYSNVSALYDDTKGKCYAIVPREEYERFKDFILERYQIDLKPLTEGRDDTDLDMYGDKPESLDEAARADAKPTYDFEIEGVEDMDPDTFFEVQKAVADEKDAIGEKAKKINVSVQTDDNGIHQITLQADNGYEKTILPGNKPTEEAPGNNTDPLRFENIEEVTRAVQFIQSSYDSCMNNTANSLSDGTQKDAIAAVSDLTQLVYDSREILDAVKAYSDAHPDENLSNMITTAQSVYDASSISQSATIIAQENDRMAELAAKQEALRAASDLSYARQMLELSSINKERTRIEQAITKAKDTYTESSYSLSKINPDMQVFTADYSQNTGKTRFETYSASESNLGIRVNMFYNNIDRTAQTVKQNTADSIRQIREAGDDAYKSAIAGALSGTVSNIERAASAYAVQTGQIGTYAQAINNGSISGNGYYAYNPAESETAKMQDRKSQFASSAKAVYAADVKPERYGAEAFSLLTRTSNVDKEGLGEAIVKLSLSPTEKIKEDSYGQGIKQTSPYYSKLNAAMHSVSAYCGTHSLASYIEKSNSGGALGSFDVLEGELKRVGILKPKAIFDFNNIKNTKNALDMVSTLAEQKGIITKQKNGAYNLKTLRGLSNRQLVLKLLGDRGLNRKEIERYGKQIRKMLEQNNMNKKFATHVGHTAMNTSKAMFAKVTDDAGKDGYMQTKAQAKAIVKSGQVALKGVEVSVEKVKNTRFYQQKKKEHEDNIHKCGGRTRDEKKQDKKERKQERRRKKQDKKDKKNRRRAAKKRRNKFIRDRKFAKFEARHKNAAKAARHISKASKGFAKGVGKIVGAPGKFKRLLGEKFANTMLGKLFAKYNVLTEFINKIKMKIYKAVGTAAFGLFKIVVIMMLLFVVITTVCNLFEDWKAERHFKNIYDFIQTAELEWQDAIFKYGLPNEEYQVGQFEYGAGFESIEEYVSKIEDLTGNGYTFTCGDDNGQKFIYAPLPFGGATDDMRKHMAYIDGGNNVEIHNTTGTWGNTSNIKELLSMLEVYDGIETDPEIIYENRYLLSNDVYEIESPDGDTSIVKLNLPSAKIMRDGTSGAQVSYDGLTIKKAPLLSTNYNRLEYGYIRYLFDATHQEQMDLQFTTNPTKGSVLDNNPDSVQADAMQATDEGAETAMLGIDYCTGPVGEEKTDWGSEADALGNSYSLYGCTSYKNFYYNKSGYISDSFDSSKNFHGAVKERASDYGDSLTPRYDCCIVPKYTTFLSSEAKERLSNTGLDYIFNNFGDCYTISSVSKEKVDDKPSGSASLGSIKSWLNERDFDGKDDIAKYIGLKQKDANTVVITARSDKHTKHRKNHSDETYYNKYTITISRICTGGHTGYYCGGHLKAKVTGLVYGMTEAQTDLDNQVIVEKVAESEYVNTPTKGTTVFVDGKSVRDILYCNDIFDVDCLLKHGYVSKDWTGWNEGNMYLAADRVAQDWADLYGFEYGGGTVIAGKPYSAAEIEQIIEYNKKIYPVTFTERRQKLLREALGYVGRMGYSMNHHTCLFNAPCKISGGVWCRYTDCSGFASNLWSPEISGILSTVGLKDYGNSSGFQKHIQIYQSIATDASGMGAINGDQSDNLVPGDIILKYKGANSANGGGNHAMIFMGYNPLDHCKPYRIHARGVKYGVVADDGIPLEWSNNEMIWSIYPDGANGEYKMHVREDGYGY